MTDSLSPVGTLDLRSDALAACVGCGLCLPHCPTYRVTGDERRSPRGRIALMRIVESGLAVPNEEWLAAMDTCIQCRGCETACPSGVPFGELMANTLVATNRSRRPPLSLRWGLWVLCRPRLLRLGTRILAVIQRLGLLRSAGILPARLPFQASGMAPTPEADILLFSGCVMDAWMPHVHDAAQQVIEATGTTVGRSGIQAGCCGALHEHAGLRAEAQRLARRVVNALPGDQHILVDSAGCGAMLKGYGELLGTETARTFSERVLDVHEWLADHLDQLPASDSGNDSVIVQDPCHLRHAQKVHSATRIVLAPFTRVVELDDEGLCCGAGGAFAMMQPGLAAEVRERKMAAIDRATAGSGAVVVVSANPGCALYLAAAGYEVKHPMEVVAECLGRGGKQVVADGS